MIHYLDNYFLQNLHQRTVLLIGCGGTGSLVLNRLARLNCAMKMLGEPEFHVVVVDGDVVEEHNVGRQGFVPCDIGQNKAEACIKKVNLAFGTNWKSMDEFYKMGERHLTANIVITCVDNAQFRIDFDKHFKKGRHIVNGEPSTLFYWLDCGNGKDFGQVILGSKQIKQPKSKHKTVATLKTVVDYYGDVRDMDNENVQGIEGCSYADSLERQDLFINDFIANYACDLLWNLFRNKYLEIQGVVLNSKTKVAKGISISL